MKTVGLTFPEAPKPAEAAHEQAETKNEQTENAAEPSEKKGGKK